MIGRACLATAFFMLAALATPAQADMSIACRVPEALLAFDAELKRVEDLVDRSQPVRILRFRPSQEQGPRRSIDTPTLERELARRLPDVIFTIIEARPQPGGAESDFAQIRSLLDIVDPDLVIWQVGTGDALAATNPADFADTLEEAADWIEGRDVDLVLVDPPFVPDVPYEMRYHQIVQQIDAISLRDKMNVVNQYDVTRYLLNRAARTPGTTLQSLSTQLATSTTCMPELMAEAIVRAATR
ncbi:hypothetical protein ACT6QG_11775 [Xanthobacter sp. TB0136]|uniref:hypothetical protein n=1 Tax=Xanthobacter sp. TB0136 TaxID=3459177 RepID=UPI004039DBED